MIYWLKSICWIEKENRRENMFKLWDHFINMIVILENLLGNKMGMFMDKFLVIGNNNWIITYELIMINLIDKIQFDRNKFLMKKLVMFSFIIMVFIMDNQIVLVNIEFHPWCWTKWGLISTFIILLYCFTINHRWKIHW